MFKFKFNFKLKFSVSDRSRHYSALQAAIAQVHQLQTDAASIVSTCALSAATISSSDVLKMSHLHAEISSHLASKSIQLGSSNGLSVSSSSSNAKAKLLESNQDEEKDHESLHGWRTLTRLETTVDAGNTRKTAVLQALDQLNQSVGLQGLIACALLSS
jgi:hypothetical protein